MYFVSIKIPQRFSPHTKLCERRDLKVIQTEYSPTFYMHKYSGHASSCEYAVVHNYSTHRLLYGNVHKNTIVYLMCKYAMETGFLAGVGPAWQISPFKETLIGLGLWLKRRNMSRQKTALLVNFRVRLFVWRHRFWACASQWFWRDLLIGRLTYTVILVLWRRLSVWLWVEYVSVTPPPFPPTTPPPAHTQHTLITVL